MAEDIDEDYDNVDFDDEDVTETIEALERGGSSGKVGKLPPMNIKDTSPIKKPGLGAPAGDEYGEDFEEVGVDDDDDYAF
jgi:hypothetical protein